jgi:hypothetical protein
MKHLKQGCEEEMIARVRLLKTLMKQYDLLDSEAAGVTDCRKPLEWRAQGKLVPAWRQELLGLQQHKLNDQPTLNCVKIL